MSLGKIFGFWKTVRPARKDSLTDLPTADQFRRLLARERSRTDRTGDKLAVIAFGPRCPELRRESLLRLVGILQKRLRTTDEIGWLDDEQVGVVLPGTPSAGAWKLADDICLEFPDHLPPTICTVYSYAGGEEIPEESATPAGDSPGRAVAALDALFVQGLPVWKRGLDVVGTVLGLIVLLPLFLTIALAIKLTSRGPVFFRQMRSGRGGKPFLIYKFRTMRVDAEERKQELLALNEQDGPAFKIRNDPRVTALGRFLRITSLDELPQLWNVLRGDMSLVGPRPLPCAEARACVSWQRQRLDVTPGLTCIWQVRGRSRVAFADWVRMDVEYIRKRSLWQDVKLLLLTVPAVIFRRGAH